MTYKSLRPISRIKGGDIMSTKNNKLISARKNANYTQQRVADELGISLRQYQRYENEEKIPNVLLSKMLADIFHTSIESLF